MAVVVSLPFNKANQVAWANVSFVHANGYYAILSYR